MNHRDMNDRLLIKMLDAYEKTLRAYPGLDWVWAKWANVMCEIDRRTMPGASE